MRLIQDQSGKPHRPGRAIVPEDSTCPPAPADDIPAPATHFLRKFACQMDKRITGVSSEAMELLTAYDWPGNVRELSNAIERAMVVGAPPAIRPDDLPLRKPVRNGVPSDQSLAEMEKCHIAAVLERTGGNVTHAAEILKVDRVTKIRLEVVYNHFAPFRIAWILTAVSFLSLLLSWATRWKPFHIAGWASFVAGTAAMLAGFGVRVAISGRAPVTNMYESVVYVGLGVAALGIVLELVCRRRFILTAAAGVATVALVLADNCPAVLDASLQPLQPVLRNSFWLVAHVMTITLSYAALALALGIGNVTLGYFLVGSEDQPTIRSLTDHVYRIVQIGVLLLAAGTILGAVWADYSWGRFWGWDPKEVWALVALLGYLSVLHARSAGWVREFGLAALSVLCFSLVVMAWYGVNFVLGAGLHSYGFGGGGQTYVFSAIAVQGLYVATAGVRYVVSGAAAEAHRAAAARAVSPAASTE